MMNLTGMLFIFGHSPLPVCRVSLQLCYTLATRWQPVCEHGGRNGGGVVSRIGVCAHVHVCE